MAFRFRTAFYKLVPSWLSTGDGEAVLTAVTSIIDANVERFRQALIARFPSQAGPSALALTGNDRGIPRGRTEVDAHYVERLRGWRFPRGHRTRGSAFALLAQVSEYFGGLTAFTRDDKGNLHERALDGQESFEYDIGFNWDFQGMAYGGPKKSRFWLVLYPMPSTTIKPWPKWSAAFGGGTATTWGAARAAGYTWGQQGLLGDDTRALKRLFRGTGGADGAVSWKPAGTRAVYAVVLLEPIGGPTSPEPDGTWDTVIGRAGSPHVIRFWNLT